MPDRAFMLHEIAREFNLELYDVCIAAQELGLRGRLTHARHGTRLWAAEEVGRIVAHLEGKKCDAPS